MNQIARVVALLHDGKCQFKHINEFQKQGIDDDRWVPEIAKEGCWIIISGDRSKQNKSKKSKHYRGEKMRVVCKQYNVTLVEMSQKIHHLPTMKKIALLLLVWSDLMKVAEAPPGSRHLIRFAGNTEGRPIVVQIEPPLPPDAAA
jgi:hypothetical protein